MTLRPILRLCRIPAVFTALGNVIAGVVLARGGCFHLRDLLVVGASAGLYLGGMVLNDYCDRAIDAIERPERPIPSGEVTPAFARGLAIGLLAAGVLLAALHGGAALAVALPLAACVVAYDAWAKGTPLGPLAMGACRFLNVCLGLAVAAPRPGWTWLAPEAIGAWTIAITYLARDEVAGLAARRARIGVGLALGTLLGVGLALVVIGPLDRASAGAMLATGAIFGYLLGRARRLFLPLLDDATPGKIGPAIGGGILMMPAIDALMLAAAGHLVAAAIVFALPAPALWLRRRYYLT
jgi:4-hydroxybenzoate polyprenyltransferase